MQQIFNKKINNKMLFTGVAYYSQLAFVAYISNNILQLEVIDTKNEKTLATTTVDDSAFEAEVAVGFNDGHVAILYNHCSVVFDTELIQSVVAVYEFKNNKLKLKHKSVVRQGCSLAGKIVAKDNGFYAAAVLFKDYIFFRGPNTEVLLINIFRIGNFEFVAKNSVLTVTAENADATLDLKVYKNNLYLMLKLIGEIDDVHVYEINEELNVNNKINLREIGLTRHHLECGDDKLFLNRINVYSGKLTLVTTIINLKTPFPIIMKNYYLNIKTNSKFYLNTFKYKNTDNKVHVLFNIFNANKRPYSVFKIYSVDRDIDKTTLEKTVIFNDLFYELDNEISVADNKVYLKTIKTKDLDNKDHDELAIYVQTTQQ